jgi:dTDP-4-amino-4,6-dideoxygalactose transaminase
MIPITKVALPEGTEELVLEVVRSGQLAQGELVARFEREFAELHDVAHAVAVNNGTTALIAAMQVLDIGPGDEVVTTPFTFVATLNAILHTGATVRFADIGSDFNIDAAAVSALVTDRTKAILPVHLYGYPAQMDAVMACADRHDLAVVEDAAQAVGASFEGTKVGGFGLGCFSLYATKNLSTGEGGVVTTNDDVLADRLRLLRNQGMRQRYQYEMAGNNYRLTNLAAAIGLPQLRALPQWTERRRANAAALTAGLQDIAGIVPPAAPSAGRTHVYHQYTIRVTDEAGVSRDDFVDRLTERGIGCGIYYPRVVFDYDCYRGDPRIAADDIPNAYATAREVVSLPVHPFLTAAELDEIVAGVRAVVGA